MHIKANGRSAFVIAAGLLALYAAPVRACESSGCQRIVLAQASEAQAQPSAQPDGTASEPEENVTRKTTHHARRSVHKSDRQAAKSAASDKKKPDGKMYGAEKTAEPGADKSGDNKAGVAPAIANANAQMAAPASSAAAPINAFPDPTVAGSGSPPMAGSNTLTPGDQAAAADQPATAAMDEQIVAPDQLNDLDRAAADDKSAQKILRATSQTVRTASGSDDAWSQTSLIGKIFIAFGGILTLASAARMFIA